MKILIVEDQPRLGQFLERGLKECAYTVRWVSTCKDALDALAESSFDVPTADVARAKLGDPGGASDARTVIRSGSCRPESHGKPAVREIRCPHRHKHEVGIIGVRPRSA